MERTGDTLALLLVIMLILPASSVTGDPGPGSSIEEAAWGRMALPVPSTDGHFTENLGQWDDEVRFLARTPFGEASFSKRGIEYNVAGHHVMVTFQDGAPVGPVGMEEKGWESNYFLGDDPDRWVTGAQNFDEIVYEDVWPGIDMIYRFSGGDLKYDVIVGVDADPTSVRFSLDGHQGLVVGDDRLDIRVAEDLTLTDGGLCAYYEDGDAADVRFSPTGDGFGFDVDKDPDRVMVIDPVVTQGSTFVGGTYDDVAVDVEVDDDGNIYIASTTGSADFPVTSGVYDGNINSGDVAVTKLNYNCSRILWSTFIGGSSWDFVFGLELDEWGAVYISGTTWSSDFPTTKGVLQEEFNWGQNTYHMDFWVSKLTYEGKRLEYSTYVGGTGPEQGGGFAVREKQVCGVGWTESTDFPTEYGTTGTHHGDAIMFMLDENGSEVVDTWVGRGAGSETILGVDFASNGDVVMGGRTSSDGFMTTPGAFQERKVCFCSGFVTRYSTTRDEVVFSTFLGGAYDTVVDLTLDDADNIYIAGTSLWSGPSASFPVTPGAFDTEYNGRSEAFACKMDPTGSALDFSTLLGGDGDDVINDIELDGEGNVVLVGSLGSGGNFTVTDGCLDPVFEGDSEGFLFLLNDDGTAPVYSTFIGGDQEDGINGAEVTSWDNYVLAGSSSSADLPATEGAYQPRLGGYADAVVQVIGDLSPPSAPRDLDARDGEGSIVVDWKAPQDDGGYDVRHYLVYRGLSPDRMVLIDVIGDRTIYIDHDVEWGVVYHYAVEATNLKGRSPLSNIDSARSATVPDPVLNLTGTVHLDRISLAWEAPNFTGGLPLTGFNLYKGTVGNDTELVGTLSSGQLVYDDTQLVDRTIYVYELAAMTEYGESRTRPSVTLRAHGPPSPPLDLRHSYGDLFIDLAWDEPMDDCGEAVTAYNVYRSVWDGPEELVGSTAVSAFMDEDVEIGTHYTYRVRAVNAKGEGDTSDTIEAVAMVPPDAPIDAAAVAGQHFVKITWSVPAFDGASPLIGYRVYLVDDAQGAIHIGSINVKARPNAPLLFLHDVPYDGQSRSYYITAVNAEGESGPSPVASTGAIDVPGAPRDLAVARGDGRLILTWIAPDYDGGAPVLSFTLYRRGPSDEGFVALATLSPDTLRFVDDTVENGAQYHYHIAAANFVGEGVPSPSVLETPAGPPAPPGGVAAVGFDRSARVLWHPPADTGGLLIDGYRVYRISEGMQVELLTEVGPGAREYEVLDLTNGDVCLFAVRAFTEAGISDLSTMVEARPVGPPGALQGLAAYWMDGHVYVTWSSPLDDGGSPISGYTLFREDRVVGNWAALSAINTTYLDADVVPGMTYNYTVRAWSDVGDGPWTRATVEVPEEPEVPPEMMPLAKWPYLLLALLLAGAAVAVVAMSRGRKGVVE